MSDEFIIDGFVIYIYTNNVYLWFLRGENQWTKRKKFIGLLFFILIFAWTTVGNANTLKNEQTRTSSGGVTISVHSDIKVRELRMYSKPSGKWNLFYVNRGFGYTDKKFFVSKNRNSASENFNIKIVVADVMVTKR